MKQVTKPVSPTGDDGKMASASTTPSRPSSLRDHIPVLDGLRGIAILLVMNLHIWELSWLDITALLHSPVDIRALTGTGFFGVDLFFFLSAFCLTLPYARHFQTGTPMPTWRHFFSRRIAKIIPSYYLSLAILLIFFLPQDIAPNELWFHIGMHVLFIHNWFFPTHGSLNGVLWSLGVEVQFYLLFPLLMLGFRRSPLITLWAMVAAGQCWGAMIVQWFRTDHDIMLFAWHDLQLPAYLTVFAAGIAAASFHVYLSRRINHQRWAPLFTLLTILAIAAFWKETWACFEMRYTPFPLRYWQVQYRILTSATFLVLGVAAPFSLRLFQTLLANRLLIFFSLVSYNLYIWHQWIARWMMDHHLPAPRTHDPHDDLHWQIVYTISAWITSLTVATVITYFWERPFLRGTLPWSPLLQSITRKQDLDNTASDSPESKAP